MQTLPWTIVMLIIFSILSLQFFHSSIDLSWLNDLGTCNKTLFHEIENKKSLSHLKEMTRGKTKKHETKKNKSSNAPKQYQSHRLKNYGRTSSKIYIYPLFQGDLLTRKWVTSLCHLYYDKAPFIDHKDQIDQIISHMYKAGSAFIKKNAPSFEWQDLMPTDPTLKKIYFHMVKGSKQFSYDAKDQYYPSLDMLFSIKSHPGKKTLYFHDLPLPTLECLFSKDLANSVIQEEEKRAKTKLSTLSKEEITSLFTTHGYGEEIISKIDLSSKPKKNKQDLSCSDPKWDMSMKKNPS